MLRAMTMHAPNTGRARAMLGPRAAIAAALVLVAGVVACQPARSQARDTRVDEMPAPAGPDDGENLEPVAVGPRLNETDVSSVVGKPAPGWDLAHWINAAPLTVESLRGSVVLVRWFMSPSCPFCSASAPSLNAFDEQYAPRGLRVIGMYHHKDEQPLDPEDVQAYVKHFGFTFPVAIDTDWQTLRRWWLDEHERSWTSVSFLLDRAGIIRYVHLGGEYVAGDADHAQMQRWIESLLAEP